MSKSKKKKDWVRTFEVCEPVKHEKGHMTYEVTSWLFPMGFPEASTKLVTKKRFSDFQKLHKALSQIHKSLYLSGKMPSLPKSGYFQRYDAKTLSDRRSACLELLNFAAQHPQLYNSQVFLNFFATLSSPSSLNSDEDIGQLMDQGQIMEATIASTKLGEDNTPVIEPEQSQSEVVRDEDEFMPNYLNEAANVIKKAIECEAEERFDESVACYRKAIGTLLTSMPKDKSLKRQASVKRRIAQYIGKAEQLTKIIDKDKIDFPHLDLFCDVKDLKRYRIDCILGKKVLLALDSKEDNSYAVIKTLAKSSLSTRKSSLLPIKNKYMAKLKRYYETNEELILVVEYISPGPLFNIIHPYLREQASRLFSHEFSTSNMSVITPDPEFIRSRSASLQVQDNDEDEDLEIVHKQIVHEEGNDASDDEISELLCLSSAGIEKIECYDREKRDKERFEMLDDHAKEVIKKLDDGQEGSSDESSENEDEPNSNLLFVNRLLTPALSSAPISVPSTAPVSPVASPLVPHVGHTMKLHEIIPSFGGIDLGSSSVLPMGLLKSWTVQLIKAILDLHSRRIYVQDLNTSNLLLSENGELILTYQCQWASVDNPVDLRALNGQYVAPEAVTLIDATPEADWWSVGVLLFELLTGWSFAYLFPSGLKSHTPLCWNPNDELRDGEAELRDLISRFLQPLPEMRLTSPKEIKSHRFFLGVDWTN